jgi:hypothetical protein
MTVLFNFFKNLGILINVNVRVPEILDDELDVLEGVLCFDIH